MEVRLLGGHLRRLLGGKQVDVRSGAVRSLLDQLVERGGAEVAAVLFEPLSVAPTTSGVGTGGRDPGTDVRALSRDLRVLVNGRSVAFLDGLETAVAETDTVTLHLSGIRGFPGG